MLPAPSIIVEWDNAVLSGAGRAQEMFLCLLQQLRDLSGRMDGRTQLAVVYDPARITSAALSPILHIFADDASLVQVMLCPLTGAKYLEYKNEGFKWTTNAVVIFLDSDVIPESNWLRDLLTPFANPGVQVLMGSSYIDCSSIYGRAFAMFWFFPPRIPSSGVRPVNHLLFANNVAFRREIFKRFPFPLCGYHGNKDRGAHAMWRAGIPVLQQVSARVAHPPPYGFAFFQRAVAHGYDLEAIKTSDTGKIKPWSQFLLFLQRSSRRIDLRRAAVEVHTGDVLFARILAFFFYGFVLIGHIATLWKPALVRKYIFS